MAKTDNLTDFLTSVADAIRAKKGTSDLINPQNFDSEIAGISTSKEEQEKSVTITENGTTEVLPDSGKALSKVTVTTNVPANVATKTITANGTYNATDDSVDGYSTVDVNVAGIEDISTSDEMTALLVAANVGKVYRFTGTTDETYTNGDLYEPTYYTVESVLKFRQYAWVKPQLSTPVNVSANGTTVSWDEVENTTRYAVLADGASIGEYVPEPSGYDLLIGGHDMYSGGTDTIAYIMFNGVATSTDYDWKAYTENLTSYVKGKIGTDVSFPLELNNITNVNIYLEQGAIDLCSQSFNTIGNHNIVLSTNENTNISMVAYG